MNTKPLKKGTFLLLAAALCIGMLFASALTSANAASSDNIRLVNGTYEPGEVIVMFGEDAVKEKDTTLNKARGIDQVGNSYGKAMKATGDSGVAADNAGSEVSILKKSLGDDFAIKDTLIYSDSLKTALVSSEKYSTKQMIEMLSKNEKIAAAEPNVYLDDQAYDSYELNDEYAAYLYQNNSPSAKNTTGQSVDSRGFDPEKAVSINAASGWKKLSGNEKESVVTVIDTGINPAHEDLKNVLWTNPGNIDLKGTHGYNFVNDSSDITDHVGHGTHCAGLIAAEGNNNKGIAGMTAGANVRIMALEILDDTAQGSKLFAAFGAFNYVLKAKERGVNIVATSNSWGRNDTQSSIFSEIIDKMGDAGILTYIAAGNEATDLDHDVSNPSSTESEYGISVGAAGITGQPANFTNYGKMHVDLFAPGVNTLSTVGYTCYFPNIYNKSELDKTTEYYGMFDVGTKVTGNKVTPGKGTGGEDVKQFGESVFKVQHNASSNNPVTESQATCEMEIADDHYFTSGKNNKSLKVTIKKAQLGEKYFVYFPFIKNSGTTGSDNTKYSIYYESGAVDDDAAALVRGGEVVKDKAGTLSLAGNGSKGHSLNKENTIVGTHLVVPEGNGGLIIPADSEKESTGLGLMITPTNENDKRDLWQESNTHDLTFYLDSIGLSKPDAEIDHNAAYEMMSGTSMACPSAAGAGALIAALNPRQNNESGADYSRRIRDLLFSSVRQTDAMKDKCTTGGYIDLSSLDTKNPVINDAVCDLKKNTLTLHGRNLSSGQTLSYRRVLATGSKEVRLPFGKMTLNYSGDGRQIVISNARELFGTMTEFKSTRKDGACGKRTFFLVKGQKKLTLVNYEQTSIEELKKGFDNTYYNVVTNKSGSKLFALEQATSTLYEHNGKDFIRIKGTNIDSAFKQMLQNKGLDQYEIEARHKIEIMAMKKMLNYGNMLYVPLNDSYSDGKDTGVKNAQYLAVMDLSKKNLSWSFIDFPEKPKIAGLTPAAPQLEVIGNKIYSYTADSKNKSNSALQIFDISTKKWTRGPDLPGKVRSPLLQRYNDKLYVMFGWNAMKRKGDNIQDMLSDAVYRLDGNKWTRTGSLKYAGKYASGEGIPDYSRFCAPAKNGLIFMDTSVDGYGNVFLYDPDKDKKTPMYYTINDSNSDNIQIYKGSCTATQDGIFYTREYNNEIQRGYGLWLLPASDGAYMSIYDQNVKATFAPLMLKGTAKTKKSVKLTWKKAGKAAKYVIYGGKASKKSTLSKLTTTKNSSAVIKMISKKKLKKGTYYKFRILALDKNDLQVSKSKDVYVSTKGNKKKANPKGLTVKSKIDSKGRKLKKYKKVKTITLKSTAKVKTGSAKAAKLRKSAKLKVMITKPKKSKIKKFTGVKFESSNTEVAKVNKNGTITAKNKGTCKIFAYAQNGVSKIVKVKVK